MLFHALFTARRTNSHGFSTVESPHLQPIFVTGGTVMPDLTLLVLTVGFFAAAILYGFGCDRL